MSVARLRRWAALVGLLLVVALMAARLGWVAGFDQPLERLELVTYDLRMQANARMRHGAEPPSTPIVIVDIDERSLQREGHWPWSRQRMAELLDRLFAAGAAVVAFDILFAEPQRNPVDAVAAALGEQPALIDAITPLADQLDGDRRFAEAMAGEEVVLGYVFSPVDRLRVGQLPPPLPLTQPALVAELGMPAEQGYTAPLPILAQAAAASGFFSIVPDADGLVRRVQLLARLDDQLYGALAVETVRQFLFFDELHLEVARIGESQQIEQIWLDADLIVPTDGHGRMLIPYRGPRGTFPYLSAGELLSGGAQDAIPDGAIVLVGTTAPGLFDLRATPMGPVFPGVEIQANVVAALLDGDFLVVPSWAKGANLVIGVVLGILLALLLPRLAPLAIALVLLVTLVLLVVLTETFWLRAGLILDLATPMLMVVVLVMHNLLWGFFFEERAERQLKEMFGQYVPPQLVEEMSEHPGDFGFEGQSKELSVLFADIRGFTTLSESLPADELKRLLNRFFTPMTRIIFDHRGTIDKYIGDLVMAFWGAPVDDPEHAAHAIEAALTMLAETERLSAEFTAQGWPPVAIGIGINSGPMNVGDMGSEYRRAYTVLGDAVNLASRLEGTTKYYGVGLVVGERTRALAGERFVWRELDRVRVKGKQQPVHVYQPVCRAEEATAALHDELAQLEAALAAYRRQQWEAAEAAFTALQQVQPTLDLYALYLERIAELRREPPPADWDGSWVRTEK